jgi:fluoroacetyl-CoA thioesterase
MPTNTPPQPLAIGRSATASLTVTGADLANVLNQNADDAFPAVYATSRMIGLMELAAARAMRPALAEGELSVGVTVDISHSAASPIGAEVIASARFVGQEGKLFVFEISARDGAGEVGRGSHKRAIVSEARLLKGAHTRAASATSALPEPTGA